MSPVICYLRYTFLYAIQWTSVQYFIFISRDFLITILALVISFWWCLCLSLFFSSRLLLPLLLLLYIYQITVSLNLFKQRTHVLSIMMWLPFLSPLFPIKMRLRKFASEVMPWPKSKLHPPTQPFPLILPSVFLVMSLFLVFADGLSLLCTPSLQRERERKTKWRKAPQPPPCIPNHQLPQPTNHCGQEKRRPSVRSGFPPGIPRHSPAAARTESHSL